MYFTIRIVNGNFKIYDTDNQKFRELTNPNVNKENLKKKILEVIESEVSPIKVRKLIYTALSLLSGYDTKKPCKSVIEQEATDPLYQELYHWVLNLNEYQEFIKSSRKLQVTLDEFIISDINGIISIKSNEEVNLKNIEKELIVISSKADTKTCSASRILIDILSKHFNVAHCTLNHSNSLIESLLQKISYFNIKKDVVFKDGKILIRIRNDYFPPEPHITVEALKAQIVIYLRHKKNIINKSEIIFSSLEVLTGLKVVKNVKKYITTYIGENKVRKDVLVEDPLYAELCEYLETLPEFQEARKRLFEINQKRLNAKKQNQILTKEQKFVDQNFTFYGTYLPQKRVHH